MDSLSLSSLSYVDIIIACSFLLFIIIGVVRGFTNDILSLLTWLGAIVITKELFPVTQPFARQVISEPFFSDVILAFLIFILSLICLVFIAKSISRLVRKSALNGLDRTFGIFSGSFRAVVLLVGAYFIILMFYKTGETPQELRNARLLAAVHIPARYAHDYLIPKDLFPKRLLKHLYGEQSVYQDQTDIPDLVKSLSSPQPKNQSQSKPESATKSKKSEKPPEQKSIKPTENGYHSKDRQALESLIQDIEP